MQQSYCDTHGDPGGLTGRVRLGLEERLFGSRIVVLVEERRRYGVPPMPGSPDTRPVRMTWRGAHAADLVAIGGGPFKKEERG